MNETTQKPQTSPSKPPPERTPIPIVKLLFSAANPHGVKLPDGPDGRNERVTPNLTSGVNGDVKVEIDWRPWLRVFRVAKSKRVTTTGRDGKEVVHWTPMGRPFVVPESWAVAILADE